MDADYAEQLRYAPEKVAWYSGQVGWMKLLLSEQQGKDQAGGKGVRKKDEKLSRSFVHPLTINREVGIPRLDFPKYVLLAPFAAWEARDWPETHWRRLAWLLKEAGYEIVAIGTKAEAERMERTFNKSYA
jgi:ADP-heptose:LPS heptosyltransferase